MSLEVRHLTHIYNKGTAMESCAVKDVSFTLEDGDFVGVIGHTGSGKSTLIQHLNGLEQPTEGTVLYNGEDIFAEGYDLKSLRGKVGLVFQYPEYQLFEETVLKDVMFGPLNMGRTKEEAEGLAREALKSLGLDESYLSRSPFELSGGEKRRAALAGILAMEPEVLILDEPTAGLDPRARLEMLELVRSLHEKKGISVLLVSHSMDDVAEYADKILVMDNAELKFFDTPKEVFKHREELLSYGLDVPEITEIAHTLREAGFEVPEDLSTLDEAVDAILKAVKPQA